MIKSSKHAIDFGLMLLSFVPKLLALVLRLFLSGKVKRRSKSRPAAAPARSARTAIQRRLDNVSLVAVATTSVEETLDALKYSCRSIDFKEVILLAHYTPWGCPTDTNFRFHRIPKMASVDDWSKFVVYELDDYISTEYIILVHADGFVVNPELWSDEFMKYDYIGAPWPLPSDDFSYRDPDGTLIRVGNSVSLRSKLLLGLPKKLDITWEPFHGYYNEDGFICVKNHALFEANGQKFPPLEVAVRFSQENMIPETEGVTPFAFHKWYGKNRKYPNFKIKRLV